MIQMSQLARTAILKIIDEEGGWVYTDHPKDKDRGTYAGVRFKVFRDYYSIHVAPEHTIITPLMFKTMAKSGTIKDIIIDIYYEEYYQRLKIFDLPDVLKMPVFSCGVNTGQRRAGIILQRTINEILKYKLQELEGTIAKFVEVDGFIGDLTLSAVNDIFYQPLRFTHNMATPLRIDGKIIAAVNMDKFRNTFIKRWQQRYVNITIDEPEYLVFLAGWFNRANKYWVY